MSTGPKVPVTQRAYTLRLRGVDPKDDSWRDALWATHEAVNKGAKAFGDWLLTLRGGLDHGRGNAKVPAKGKKPERDPTPDEIKNRQIALALSWLSVESEDGAPKDYLVEHQCDTATNRRSDWKTLDELRKILKKRAVADSEIEVWASHCEAALSARIRHDAVWVNRSKVFDELITRQDSAMARADCQSVLSYLFSDDFLVLPVQDQKKASHKKGAEGQQESADSDESQSETGDIERIESGKGAGQKTRRLYLHLFGNSKEFRSTDGCLRLREFWGKYLKPKIDSSGIPCWLSGTKEKDEESKKVMSHQLLNIEMTSKAASRLAQIWTKQKQQEVERQVAKQRDEALHKMEADVEYAGALCVLTEYCRECGRTTGAHDEFRIRPGQITAWDQVVEKWKNIKEADPEQATEKRKQAAKDLQDNDKERKFGDVNLFIALAEDHCKAVWNPEGRADATILQRFAYGMKARADAERLKVASYRHPDPYLHPVFVQFGESRPKIKFGRLSATVVPERVELLLWKPSEGRADMVALAGVSKRFDREIGTICESKNRVASKLPAVSRRSRLGMAAVASPNEDNARGKGAPTHPVAYVFDRKPVKSRKKKSDANSNATPAAKEKDPEWNGSLLADRRLLTRIGRLKNEKAGSVNQAAVEKLKRLVHWHLSVSVEVRSNGPWYEYVRHAADQSPFVRTVRKDVKDKDTNALLRSKGSTYIAWDGWPFQEINEPLKTIGAALTVDTSGKREGFGRLILCRLPGLRVLSVDLGHRFAAACAVWEALSGDVFRAAIEGKTVARGGVGPGDLFAHVQECVADGQTRTIVYRRIGPDTLDGEPHPAPWARLERQFLIKLQGEDEEAREASNEEIWFVHELECKMGLAVPLIDRLVHCGWGRTEKQRMRLEALRGMGGKPAPQRSDMGVGAAPKRERRPSLSVDELMADTVRSVRLALRRHGDRARIAFAMTAEYKPMPGGRKLYFDVQRAQNKDDEFDKRKTQDDRNKAHIEYITDALEFWHTLATSDRWADGQAPLLWKQHIEDPYGVRLEKGPSPDESEAPAERKKRRTELRQKLEGAAANLVRNSNECKQLHARWAERWRKDDEFWGGKHHQKKNGRAWGGDVSLQRLQRWILPRGIARVVEEVQPDGSRRYRRKLDKGKLTLARDVGGLSLTRINTLTGLYQLLKAYRMRPEPDDLRKNVPEKGDDALVDFHRRLLETRDRMREQRVKQLASRIAEAALGIGIERPLKEDGRQLKRPRERLYWKDENGNEHWDRRFAPCHAVVIENLTNYRPDELQTRRENRQLMSWSSSKVKKYLAEACQLHGLHLREVSAAYTSRQDSRTGMPGVRCSHVSRDAFAKRWRRRINQAQKKQREGKGDALDRYLLSLEHNWAKGKDGADKPWVLIPERGGEFFVSAAECANERGAKAPSGLQADLNAAANIGLNALTDPDWEGRWWYVPCVLGKLDKETTGRTDDDRPRWYVPDPKRCAGAAPLKDFRVAPTENGYSKNGTPISPADDASVKAAHEKLDSAKAELDAAKKAHKSKTTGQNEKTKHALDAAGKSYEEAKKACAEAKKGARAAGYLNVWRHSSSELSGEPEWMSYSKYWNIVQANVIRRLAGSAGLQQTVDTATPW